MKLWPAAMLYVSTCCALLLAHAGCMGTDVGNPPQTVKTEVEFVGIDGAVSDPVADGGDAVGDDTKSEQKEEREPDQAPPGAPGMLHAALISGEADLTEAWIVVDALRFRPEADCEEHADVTAPVFVAVELISGQTYPAVPEVALEAGLYCRMEADLSPREGLPTGAPAELEGASVLVRGVFADGSAFVLRYEKPLTLRYKAPDAGFAVEAAGRLFGGFQMAAWFEDDDGVTSPAPGESEVRIDERTDPTRVEHFIAAFRASTKLHRDDNGNRSLDPSEIERPVADSVDHDVD